MNDATTDREAIGPVVGRIEQHKRTLGILGQRKVTRNRAGHTQRGAHRNFNSRIGGEGNATIRVNPHGAADAAKTSAVEDKLVRGERTGRRAQAGVAINHEYAGINIGAAMIGIVPGKDEAIAAAPLDQRDRPAAKTDAVTNINCGHAAGTIRSVGHVGGGPHRAVRYQPSAGHVVKTVARAFEIE